MTFLNKRRFILMAITVLVVFSFLAATLEVAQADGKRCYNGVTFFKFYRNNSWHHAAYVPVDVSAPLVAWHAHGPRKATLWPDSVRSHYVLVYFALPGQINPWYFYKPWDFQACLN